MATAASGGPRGEFAGTETDDNGPIDPASLIGGSTGDVGDSDDYVRDSAGNIKRNKDGSPRRKRGRKAGSKNGASTPRSSADLKNAVETLSRSLQAIHVGLAIASRTPELSLDGDEAKLLAEATANVMEQYDLKPDPKTEALIGLIVAAGTVYVPRYVTIRLRKQQERQERKARENAPGVAGVYGTEGEPLGTTEYTTTQATMN